MAGASQSVVLEVVNTANYGADYDSSSDANHVFKYDIPLRAGDSVAFDEQHKAARVGGSDHPRRAQRLHWPLLAIGGCRGSSASSAPMETTGRYGTY